MLNQILSKQESPLFWILHVVPNILLSYMNITPLNRNDHTFCLVLRWSSLERFHCILINVIPYILVSNVTNISLYRKPRTEKLSEYMYNSEYLTEGKQSFLSTALDRCTSEPTAMMIPRSTSITLNTSSPTSFSQQHIVTWNTTSANHRTWNIGNGWID